jgi:ABC-type antimicrobial peptide transport system permease subunit
MRALVTRAQDQLVQNVRPALRLLTGAVALVLLIGCANVANLLLVRTVDRQKEIAVRVALGASRARIVRQLVVESLVLASAGGIVGLLLASWAVSLLTTATVPGLPRAYNIGVHWPIVFFAFGLSLLTGIVFGLVPAVQATQLPIRESLNEEGRSGSVPKMEVVGIVGDMKQSFEAASRAEMFVPYAQYPDPILNGMYLNTALIVRTAGNPVDVTASVRSAIREIDPGLPLVNVRTMDRAIAGTVAQPRLQMLLLVIFAGVAVVLATVGVYGVMAYTVSQRVPEIGVRMAIGASPSQVVGMVVWQGTQLALLGVIVGLIASVLAATAMQSLLFDVSRLDPVTFVIAPVVLGVAAIVASYLPARRAAEISPLAALGR